MKTRRRLGGAASYAASALALLALLAWQPAEAKAQWATSNSNISNTNAGNVGVGTGSNAPGAKLDVGAGAAARGGNTDLLIGAGGNIPQIEFFGVNKSAVIQYNDADGMLFFTNAPSWTQTLYLGNSGWVGVGTSAPSSQFHVQNSSGAGFVRVTGLGGGVMNFEDSSASSGQRLYQWRSEGGVFRLALSNDAGTGLMQQNILVASSSGNVGIGTASPSYPLDLQFANGGSATVARFRNSNAGSNTVISFDALANQNANIELANGGVNKWYIRNNASEPVNSNRLSFFNSGGGAEVLSVLQGGNVGIGATNPTHKLEVGGDINAAGAVTGLTINATYQDVAEWVPSTQKLAAGIVVVLDTSKTNHVLASKKAYDTGVAGVVSDTPGVILGQGGADKVKVATTGRVKVRVDATRAPIKVGDLLVTSEAEGVAMKSVPVDLGGVQIHRPGTIIGKALEPLDKGTGEILVLLSLQ